MSITVVHILILVTVLSSFYAWQNAGIKTKWIHNPYLANRNKEYYRLLSSGFIHADYLHLFFNMYALYLFGGVVEVYFRILFADWAPLAYLALYLIGILVANLPDFFRHRLHPGFNALGASGGVSSVVFCSIVLNPMMELMLFPIPLPLPGYIFALLYVAYSYYMDKKQIDNIGHMAHLWGGLWGIAFILLAEPGSLLRFFAQIRLPF